jgi:phosphoribosyl 1,2-cyclic phosphodiesterase
MNLAVLGSGSRGNAVVIWDHDATILIDAGFGIRTLQRRMKAIGLAGTTVRAIVLTHEHSDHARGAGQAARAAGCPIVASPGTLRALAMELESVDTITLTSNGPTDVGGFRVRACPTPHDAAEPVAVRIERPGRRGRYAVAQDVGHVTAPLTTFLGGCTGLVVEANHDEHMLATGPYPPRLRARIAGRLGHLSNADTAALLRAVVNPGLEFVVLSHLSQQCNAPAAAERAVDPALRSQGFAGRLLIASQDEPLHVVPAATQMQYALELQ